MYNIELDALAMHQAPPTSFMDEHRWRIAHAVQRAAKLLGQTNVVLISSKKKAVDNSKNNYFSINSIPSTGRNIVLYMKREDFWREEQACMLGVWIRYCLHSLTVGH